MDKISTNEAINFFKFLELPENRFMVNGKVVDIYTILGFEPEFRSDGTRKLTPYELIGIPPQFYPDGRERPIVFCLKNKVRKLGKYEGENKEFFKISGRSKERVTTLDELKSRYKTAVYEGREYDALEILKVIDEMTNGNAEEFLRSFFNSRKFYKKMRKQLIIDLFAHFFMVFCMSHKRVKSGIMTTTKIFRPYREESSQESIEDIDEMSVVDYSANIPDSQLETITFQSFNGLEPEEEALQPSESAPVEPQEPEPQSVESEPKKPEAPVEDMSIMDRLFGGDKKDREREKGSEPAANDFNFLISLSKRVRPARRFGRIFGGESEEGEENEVAPVAEKAKVDEREATLNFDR